jgi:hypothetical protein
MKLKILKFALIAVFAFTALFSCKNSGEGNDNAKDAAAFLNALKDVPNYSSLKELAEGTSKTYGKDHAKFVRIPKNEVINENNFGRAFANMLGGDSFSIYGKFNDGEFIFVVGEFNAGMNMGYGISIAVFTPDGQFFNDTDDGSNICLVRASYGGTEVLQKFENDVFFVDTEYPKDRESPNPVMIKSVSKYKFDRQQKKFVYLPPEASAETSENQGAESEEFVVQGEAFVVVLPTKENYSKAIEDIKKQYGGDDMAEIGSDVANYEFTARQTVTAAGIKVIDANAKVVKFKKSDGSFYTFRNDAVSFAGEYFLFNGKNDPKRLESIASFDENERKAFFGR